ncbi:MarR family transcriptional regulator [Streptomyces phaeochromogenes]|uniref:MarR family winged helix-turn-helix transcriptional regulator n=1 Tax=Streptomyces phaeochromogenes TaxID=1923 RepID=UPI002DD7F144|nr:MarR family transcriptional regulator [Streptomyces phaeochromogenes]WRZ28012.1 MarR family transcriptional regulator [Streptomyces phaeochromogenes]
MTENDGFGNNLVWLSVLVQRRYAQICADHDLTPVQATLLCVIKDQPQGMGELAQLLGVAKNALSGLVDRIERRGLVQRETLQRDRRAITLSTTALGKEIVDALYADIGRRMPDIAGVLPADERHQLADSVARITARLVASPMPDAAPQGRQRTVAGTDRAGK